MDSFPADAEIGDLAFGEKRLKVAVGNCLDILTLGSHIAQHHDADDGDDHVPDIDLRFGFHSRAN